MTIFKWAAFAAVMAETLALMIWTPITRLRALGRRPPSHAETVLALRLLALWWLSIGLFLISVHAVVVAAPLIGLGLGVLGGALYWERLRHRLYDPAPVPPTNARIVHADGSVVPLELAYAGRREDGMHVWVSVTAVAPWGPLDELRVDALPPYTMIQVTGQ